MNEEMKKRLANYEEALAPYKVAAGKMAALVARAQEQVNLLREGKNDALAARAEQEMKRLAAWLPIRTDRGGKYRPFDPAEWGALGDELEHAYAAFYQADKHMRAFWDSLSGEAKRAAKEQAPPEWRPGGCGP